MAGSPKGPGSSPAAAPGAGAGQEAAAIAQLKGIFPMFYKIMSALKVGSEAWTAVSDAIKALGKVVGKTEENSLVPSAIQQMALAAKGGPMKNAPPVGLTAAPPSTGSAEPEPI